MQPARQSAHGARRRGAAAPVAFLPDTIMWELLALLGIASAGWLVWDSLRAREAANAAIRSACRAEGLLFLDDTVALASVRPFRDADGRMRLRRVYGFEYSDTGNNRCRGSVTLIGQAVGPIDVRARSVPDGVTLH